MKKKEVIPDKTIFFISYRRDTSGTIANAIVDKLEDKYKFEVFFDKHDRKFGKVKDKLKNGIDKCTHFILFIDEKTFDFTENQESENNKGNDKDYVLFEIQHALEKREKDEESIQIIPILVNGNKMPDENDERLKKNKIEKIAGFEWIEYNEKEESHNDVTKKVLERIGYNESQEILAKKNKKRKLMQSIFVILSTIVAVAALLFVGTLLQQWISSRAPKLIFAGGGSVANLIKEITGDKVDVKDNKNYIYLNLPSEDAWALMPQEVMTSHTSDDIQNKFYPVCLSAVQAKKTNFIQTVDDTTTFMNQGTIIEYKLKNEDTLYVYLDESHRKELDSLNLVKDGKIILDSLKKRISEWCKDTLFKIYITRPRSGTYAKYQEILNPIFKNNSSHLLPYGEELSENTLIRNKNGFIVLSSQNYTPNKIRDRYVAIMIEDKNIIISKQMFLYFVGKKRKEETDSINMPEQMVRILKIIDKDTNNIIKPVMYWPLDSVITPFDELKRMQSGKGIVSKKNAKPSKSK